jgi:hypothetical protein
LPLFTLVRGRSVLRSLRAVACKGLGFDVRLGSAVASNISYLLGEATRSLAVIVVMLRAAPQQRQESTADSSGQLLHSRRAGMQPRPRAHSSTSSIAKAHGRFLELPVPVVLVVMWLFGAVLLGLFLGTVLIAAYSAEVLLLGAMALL